MTRWLVTGAGGMLGQDLVRLLAARAADTLALSRRELDVTDRRAVYAALRASRPGIVVNCAAWTDVDGAERQAGAARAVNTDGARHLALACAATGAVLIHVSTDYVFAGTAAVPYPETAPAEPRTVYGRTKLDGERAVLEVLPGRGRVVRTAWLYGAHGSNFVRTVIERGTRHPFLDVVDNQYGQPTWTVDLAGLLVRLGESAARGAAPPGVYHATASGTTTWYRLAREILRLLGGDPDRIRPTTTAALGRLAPRPAYSVLGHARWAAAGLRPLGPWQAALARALPALVAAGPRPCRASSQPHGDREGNGI
ncbi:dTDP-4-dehydrorhamnose reductase [Streptomyces sp. NRRL S-31]|uniref:dTDP-4-dehydrorhamnose reductase n=1 Tax=Streptomyces sp. NRRL S-31 TaxID=1463898 RepID=UPI0004CADB72|nr:dTDP-4-dehydrorhamnose reductase [Streptomyces sp. NRRL S-31]